MARTLGPLMSIEASGKFGKTLVYSKWKGRPYCRELVIPHNPRTAKQTGVRAMMAFIADRWSYLSSVIHDTWNDLAATSEISPFNAYISENLKRWQLNKAPTQEYPAAETSTGLTITSHTYTGGAGFATLSLTPSGSTNIWGFAIFRDIAEITAPSWANAIAVIPANGANAVSYTDAPLEPDTYHYRAAVINDDGKLGTVLADDTCVVT
jgi:hypothetical protein